MKSLPQIAGKLKAAMGLDMATVGARLIERVVRERMGLLALDDDSQYLAVLLTSETELQALIELAVVPETWFFRDREAMLAVARLARERLAERPGEVVRILSLPCSTGEEPYSLAMALCDAGVTPAQFQIDAIDIRTRSLEIAAQGIYGRNSFRGQDLAFRDRHFDPCEGAWQVHEQIRRQVRFAPGNLLAPDFMRHAQAYHLILCRNVLIYFERDVQQQVVALLVNLMAEDGHLFVGPAEGGIVLGSVLESAGIPLAFGFRRRKDGAAAASPASVSRPVAPATVMPRWARTVPSTRADTVSPPVAGPAPALQPSLLQQARALADRGQLERAGSLCEQAVQEQGPSAEAFYLQGLIFDADGNAAQAQRCYRKALYLDPAHQAALLHLAALLQAQGDAAGAQRMRLRAQRTSQPGEGGHD
ncbi:CheR family methyltransferase [Herbaspirillum sp. NPDC087042]|uniref:CheR family methyltransferase n=1 Tax=Herbaspirillum sp. NPDC087042 TaxID=3364004 RepID=UPI0037F854B1